MHCQIAAGILIGLLLVAAAPIIVRGDQGDDIDEKDVVILTNENFTAALEKTKFALVRHVAQCYLVQVPSVHQTLCQRNSCNLVTRTGASSLLLPHLLHDLTLTLHGQSHSWTLQIHRWSSMHPGADTARCDRPFCYSLLTSLSAHNQGH